MELLFIPYQTWLWERKMWKSKKLKSYFLSLGVKIWAYGIKEKCFKKKNYFNKCYNIGLLLNNFYWKTGKFDFQFLEI